MKTTERALFPSRKATSVDSLCQRHADNLPVVPSENTAVRKRGVAPDHFPAEALIRGGQQVRAAEFFVGRRREPGQDQVACLTKEPGAVIAGIAPLPHEKRRAMPATTVS